MVGDVIFMDTKNDIRKTKKLISMKCLCEVIPDHVQIGTEFHRFLLLRDPISDKIISNIDVYCLLSILSSTIIFQFYGALFILIDNIVVDLVSLLF